MNSSRNQPAGKTVPLDDLPAGRLTNALALLDFQRRMGVTTWWYAIGTEQADVIADLEACGYVRVEPEPELIDAMKATLVKQRGGR